MVEDVLGVVDDRRRLAEDAGVGERDVEAAEALGRDAYRRGDLLGVGHVGHDVGGALGADLVGHDGEAVLVDVGQHHPGSLVGEQARRGGADAPSAARDQRDLALESTHGGGRLPHRVRVPAMAGETVGTARGAAVAGNGGTPAPTVREATFDVLRTLGLTPIFSNPGSTEVSFLAGLPDDLALRPGAARGLRRRAWPPATRIGRGAPAFALLHTTAGLGNAVSALATARVNRAPLVVMVGQQDRRHLAQEPFLAGRLHGLAGEYPVSVEQPVRAQDVPGALVRAHHAAVSRRGPALVIVPMDDWHAPRPRPTRCPAPSACCAPAPPRPRRSTSSPRCSTTRSRPPSWSAPAPTPGGLGRARGARRAPVVPGVDRGLRRPRGLPAGPSALRRPPLPQPRAAARDAQRARRDPRRRRADLPPVRLRARPAGRTRARAWRWSPTTPPRRTAARRS